MNNDDILGCGQFGQVIGGVCNKTMRQVAIKVIDKAKVDENKTETSYFQNEATILFNFKHPGLLELIALFDDSNFVSNLRIILPFNL
jgi:serine/threonine protein kinase